MCKVKTQPTNITTAQSKPREQLSQLNHMNSPIDSLTLIPFSRIIKRIFNLPANASSQSTKTCPAPLANGASALSAPAKMFQAVEYRIKSKGLISTGRPELAFHRSDISDELSNFPEYIDLMHNPASLNHRNSPEIIAPFVNIETGQSSYSRINIHAMQFNSRQHTPKWRNIWLASLVPKVFNIKY